MRKFFTSGRRRYALLLFVVGAGSLALMGASCAPTKAPAPAGLSISPAIGDFQSQTINPASPYGPIEYTVTNNGGDTGALDVSGVSAPFAISNDTCGGNTLGNGETCVVDVTFNPTAASGYLQTLKVDDTTNGEVTAVVAGVGVL
jgi:hypothetical protein